MTSDAKRSTAWVEFHDSTLVAVAAADNDVELMLSGYVHRWEQMGAARRGTGWTQPVRIVVRHAHAPALALTSAVAISDARLQTGDVMHGNLVELPLGTTEAVRLHLVLTTGDFVDVVGTGIEIDVTGTPIFVEDLPADLDPER
jgi:hypothetical protein